VKRKRLTGNQKLELWEKYDGKCWRCKLPIDKHKRGELHWGHIIARSIGGSDGPENRAPEHARCNLDHAYAVDTPLAAKSKRVRIRDLERPEPKMKLSRKFDGTVARWNPTTKKYDLPV
jgi:5-methylcytosine-specific restriction endonuclease McrA